MISYSEAQASAFVTDAGTLKRGQELAKPAPWSQLGRTDTAAWGACAGSGSKPYLTGIDLTEPAFKCSCPSRVFPCKHGAGLLLLLARQPALFGGSQPPDWLAEWLGKRQQTQEKKVEKAAAAPASSPTDETGPAKAPGEVDPKRLARMLAGADDLAAWLADLVRAGLATLDQQPASFWEAQAARLVDNQLPGLAAMLRELASLRHAHADWPARLLARLGELYLLVRTFQNLPNLAPEARQEVLQLVGVNLKKDDLLALAAPVADAWQVLGQFTWDEDRLTARRSWLLGLGSGRRALVLEFAFGSQPFATSLVPQGAYVGELAFYPGRLPLRAAPVSLKFDGTVPARRVPPGLSFSQLLSDYADALARQPWLREWPATLGQVLPAPQPDGSWRLHHATEAGTLALRLPTEEAGWQLLAESGGEPLTLFGEWDGRAFRVLASWAGAADYPAVAAPMSPAVSSSAARAEGEAPAWSQLLRTALLGTRQSTDPIPPFPAPAASRETQLLQAAGAVALLHKAGFRTPAAATAPPAPAPPDSGRLLGPQGADSLRQMVVDSLFLDLLPEYLQRLAGAGRLVPPALLVPLLQHASRSPATTAQLGPVLGRRGHWLAALNPAWQKLLAQSQPAEAPTDDATWDTGSLPQRLAWLRQRFAQDADAARALLLAALPTEPAKTQEALLEILAEHLHPDAEPALENLLKARGQDVRRAATELLVRLPGAALTERLWARAAPLITAKRKLLGLGSATLEVSLPTTWDKAWLADGIEEKPARFLSAHGPNFHSPVGPATARLTNLLALLPPRRWTPHLGLPPAELLPAALASDAALPLLTGWAQAALLHRDADFAAAFLELWLTQRPALEKAHCVRGIDWVALGALLPPAALHRLLLEPVVQRVRQQEPDWTADLGFVPAPWPRALSAAVLDTLAPRLAHSAPPALPATPIYELQQLAWVLPHTVAPRLAPADRPWAIAQAEAIPELHPQLLTPVHTFVATLRFEQALAASLTE